MRYVYTVWLRETSLPTDDPDREWPACFVIDGATESSAKQWGDRLARRYAAEHDHDIVASAIEPWDASKLPGIDTLPIVVYGHDASDEEIGW